MALRSIISLRTALQPHGTDKDNSNSTNPIFNTMLGCPRGQAAAWKFKWRRPYAQAAAFVGDQV